MLKDKVVRETTQYSQIWTWKNKIFQENINKVKKLLKENGYIEEDCD